MRDGFCIADLYAIFEIHQAEISTWNVREMITRMYMTWGRENFFKRATSKRQKRCKKERHSLKCAIPLTLLLRASNVFKDRSGVKRSRERKTSTDVNVMNSVHLSIIYIYMSDRYPERRNDSSRHAIAIALNML